MIVAAPTQKPLLYPQPIMDQCTLVAVTEYPPLIITLNTLKNIALLAILAVKLTLIMSKQRVAVKIQKLELC